MHMHGSDAVFPTMWFRSATMTMALVDLNCRLKMVNLLSVVESKHGFTGFGSVEKLHTENVLVVRVH
jgi:hypothetical protein